MNKKFSIVGSLNPDEVFEKIDISKVRGGKGNIDDCIRGRRLSNAESNALMFQDVSFDEEEFNEVIKPFLKST